MKLADKHPLVLTQADTFVAFVLLLQNKHLYINRANPPFSSDFLLHHSCLPVPDQLSLFQETVFCFINLFLDEVIPFKISSADFSFHGSRRGTTTFFFQPESRPKGRF